MPLPLPNLDDRRWQDLTQEAIPLIPRYAPQWTDFNTHDPGITLMEMFAWLTESMVYRLNQVPDRFIWKFLELIGYPRRGPLPAEVVLSFEGIPGGTVFEVPTGVEFITTATAGSAVPFATARPFDLVQVTLAALQVDDGSGTLRDYSRDLSDGLPVTALGSDPVPGAALYFGFGDVPRASPFTLWLWFGGPGSGAGERARIIAEAAAARAACRPDMPGWPCATTKPARTDCDFTPRPSPPHHSAQIVWEVFAGGTWLELAAVAMPGRPDVGQVVDDTRSLTLDGLVELNLPSTISVTALGPIARPLIYVRARLTGGAYDSPVILDSVAPNAVLAVQRIPLSQQLVIPATVPALPTPPTPGDRLSLSFTLAPDLSLQTLAVQSPPATDAPGFTCLGYVAPGGGNAGSITLELAIAGIATAVPSQQVYVPGAPVQNRCIRLYTHDGKSWTEWTQVPDFQASRRVDLAFTLDPTTGLITCGDGEHGQVFPQGSAIVVTGFATLGDGGNGLASQAFSLSAVPINAVLLAAVSAHDQAMLSKGANDPIAFAPGEPAVALTQLEGDAAEVVHAHERILDLAEGAQQTTLDQIPKSEVLALPAPSQAVNLLDTERIALDVPGTAVARARAWPDTDPALPGLHATGVVTVVILPDMPVAAPTPSPGLIAAVKAYLDRRRVICTRIEVAAPTYVVITVTANVAAVTGASAATVQSSIVAALDAFLNPLSGGPAQLGWPFGRSVYYAEILQLIANVPGVDHVNTMTLTADSGVPQCSDITLCPTFLVSSGAHQIAVVAS
ncbi:MAG TPA: baseplate J/gp47 family protein [Xanthobacteraceae bacterium]|nr:baseplate J/gp47 family protein [Xanthobacteraceae bacterium]